MAAAAPILRYSWRLLYRPNDRYRSLYLPLPHGARLGAAVGVGFGALTAGSSDPVAPERPKLPARVAEETTMSTFSYAQALQEPALERAA